MAICARRRAGWRHVMALGMVGGAAYVVPLAEANVLECDLEVLPTRAVDARAECAGEGLWGASATRFRPTFCSVNVLKIAR